MKINNGIKLLGKVFVLISIILIFSYVSELKLKVEGYKNKIKDNKNVKKVSENFDGTCRLPLSIPVYFILWLIKMFLWVIGLIFKQFFSEWFNEKFGKFYKFYINVMDFCIKIYEKIFKMLGTIIYKIIWWIGKIIEILSNILFKFFPKIILDIIAYILSVPFIIFGPIIDFFNTIYHYSKVICWSEEGIKNDFINWYEEKILLK